MSDSRGSTLSEAMAQAAVAAQTAGSRHGSRHSRKVQHPDTTWYATRKDVRRMK
jgi:hypothetical protein